MEAVLNNSEIASAAEQIFQAVFAVINEGVVILNDHAEITAVNPAAESMLGLAAADLIGQSADAIVRVGKLIHEDGSELSLDSFSAIVASRLRNMVLGIYRTDGTLVWLSINSQALISNGASAPYAEAIIFADITERKRTERALAAREHKFRSLADSLPDNIVRYNREGVTIYVNPVLERTSLGCAAAMIGKTPREYHSDGSYEDYAQLLDKVLASGEAGEIEKILPGAHGGANVHQIRMVPERGENGEVVGVLAIGRDITERKRMQEAQQESEARYRYHFNFLQSMLESSSTVSVFALDRECRYLAFNRRHREGAKRLRGTDIAIGMNMLESIDDKEFREFCRLGFERVLAGQTVSIESKEAVVKDGCRVYEYNENYGSPIFNDEGEVVGLTVFAINVTERKRAEEALRASEERMRLFFERQLVGMAITSAEKGWIQVNDKICEMLGYTREELMRLSWSELTYPDDLAADTAQFERMLNCEIDGYTLEKRFVRKDGSIVFTNLSVGCVRRSDRAVDYVLAMLKDITERKQVEEILRRSEQQFRTLAENFPDILVRYDREGRRTYVNPAMERIFATPAKQTIGLTLQEANPLKLPETYQKALKHTLATGERSEFEMELPISSGGMGFITMAAERDADGEICGALTIGRDITKLKQTEQQLRELTAHLQTVREEEKARLAREIHDDLGSTLAVLKLRLSHLLDFELSEEMKKTPLFARLESMSPLLENAIAATRRIITNMRPDVLDNLGLVAALKWQAEKFSKHTGIACRFVHTGERDCASCKICKYGENQTLTINLFRIFQEALTNVARHSGASRVEAEFRTGSDGVILSICDNGCGIPEGGVLASSFGIRGMRERVGQMGGEIVFDTPPGGGLRVTVRVPLSAAGACRPVLQ